MKQVNFQIYHEIWIQKSNTDHTVNEGDRMQEAGVLFKINTTWFPLREI